MSMMCEACEAKITEGSVGAAARWCGISCFATSEDGKRLASVLELTVEQMRECETIALEIRTYKVKGSQRDSYGGYTSTSFEVCAFTADDALTQVKLERKDFSIRSIEPEKKQERTD